MTQRSHRDVVLGPAFEEGDHVVDRALVEEFHRLGRGIGGVGGQHDLLAGQDRRVGGQRLERAGGNQTRAAEQLRITRRALKLKMDRYTITPG